MFNWEGFGLQGLKPFVGWVGGKRRMLGLLSSRFPASFGTFFEPFLGGGAVLLYLRPERAVVNDVNPQLVNLWRTVEGDVEGLLDCFDSLDAVGGSCDMFEVYNGYRERFNGLISAGVLDTECAGLMLWLNRHCFSNLYRVNGRGLFNTSYDPNRSGSVDKGNLLRVSDYLRNSDVEFLCGDFEPVCDRAVAGDFVFLDPPYVADERAKGEGFVRYSSSGWGEGEHSRVAGVFSRLAAAGVKVCLTNNDTLVSRDLFEGFSVESVSFARGTDALSGRRAREIVVTNYCPVVRTNSLF